jgi:hypothetical protein
MPDLYPIVEVKRASIRESEDMGSKDKFWYLHPQAEEGYWLFKYPRCNTGEHWAEKIAAEVADLLEIPHATVELAIFEEDKGSATKSFAQEDQELVHGNQMLARAVHGYDRRRRFHQSSHTLANIWQVMDRIFVESEDAEQAKLCLAEYVVLDALIGNTDRHHENWGILRERKDAPWEGFVAPSFDHASSFGRELQDTRRNRILAEDRIGDYVEKGRGAIYWSEDDPHGSSPLELVRRATRKYPKFFSPALTKLEKLDERSVDDLVNRVPASWMSPSARKFAIALMHYNFEQLQELLQ